MLCNGAHTRRMQQTTTIQSPISYKSLQNLTIEGQTHKTRHMHIEDDTI